MRIHPNITKSMPYFALLLSVFVVFSQTVDDPYITFRYASNLIHGNGLVFNQGERVEGFTSPAHVLISALLLLVAPSLDILFKAKIVSVLFALAIFYGMALFARRAGLTDLEVVLSQFLVALNINFALAAVNGLETTLYGFFLLFSVIQLYDEYKRGKGYASAVGLFLCVATRPDAILWFLALLGARLIRLRNRRDSWHSILQWASVFLMLFGGLLFFRLSYYGEIFPNTYYAKQIEIRQAIPKGASYLLQTMSPKQVNLFFLFSGREAVAQWMQVVFALSFWGLAIAGMNRETRRLCNLLCAACVLASVLFVMRCGGDWMPGWRFMAPALPFLAVLQCYGLRTFRRWFVRQRRNKVSGSKISSYVYLPVLLLWSTAWKIAPHNSWRNAHYSTSGKDLLAVSWVLGARWVAVGDFIHTHVRPGSVLIYSEMGYAGYTNMDKRFIDVRGLTDKEIARVPSRYKDITGVNDTVWFVPGDPLYNILSKREAQVIITMDPPPDSRSVLGRYHFAAEVGRDNDNSYRPRPWPVYVIGDHRQNLID